MTTVQNDEPSTTSLQKVPDQGTGTAAAPTVPMGHRQVLEALSGLLLGLLTTILSTTVVGTALPVIVGDLGGSQSAYTWVVTSSLLAMTVSTPLWGKLADLMNRKVLIQVALVAFVVASAVAGLSQETWHLIAARAVQGLAAGGVMALSMVVITDVISPRDRGRYVGIMGGVMSIGTLGGPLLGGVITDALGWRWTFYVGVPLAVIAIVVLQRTLKLPARPARAVHIDYLGAFLIAAGVSALLVWVSLAGERFAWASAWSALLVGSSVVLLVAAVRVEMRSPEPVIPPSLFRNRTLTLAVVASVGVGVAMFGASVFLAQYMQLARGLSPTASGLHTAPIVIGSLVASTVIGQLVSRTGRYKSYMIGGAASLVVGLALMATVGADTSFWLLSLYMALIGIGMGACLQNLVLATQNTVDVRQMGSATATVTFFRSLGGAVGVAALGAVLAHRVQDKIADGLAQLGTALPAGQASGSVPRLDELPAPVRTVVEQAYASGIADLFLAAIPLALVALVAICLLHEVPLGQKTGLQQRAEVEADLTVGDPAGAGAPAVAGDPARS